MFNSFSSCPYNFTACSCILDFCCSVFSDCFKVTEGARGCLGGSDPAQSSLPKHTEPLVLPQRSQGHLAPQCWAWSTDFHLGGPYISSISSNRSLLRLALYCHYQEVHNLGGICKTKKWPWGNNREDINRGRIATSPCPLLYEFFQGQLQLSSGIGSPMKQSKHKVERLRQHGPHLQLLRIGNLVVYCNLVICTSWTWGLFLS